MIKQLKLLMPLIGIVSTCGAQTFSPNLIGTTGGTNEANNISVDWTLGETAVQTSETGDKIVTEGFHQSNLRVIEMNKADLNLTELYNITVAPNPVKSVLTASVQSKLDSKVYLSLIDADGKQLMNEEINSTYSSKELNMANFATGIYFLSARNFSGSLIKTFKIIKQ